MTATNFKDLFSKQAADYAKYRPRYPKQLFDFVFSLTKEHSRAWDCGTGNGQAAVVLAEKFQEVIATDPSAKQIENAERDPKERVRYVVAKDEVPDVEDGSVDLVTAAQAAHWFDFDHFYREVTRVLKPQGVIALWSYGHNREIDPDVDRVLARYSNEIVGAFWAPEIKYVWDHYKTIPFPFKEIESPVLTMQADWNLSALIGYLWSWSATQGYVLKFKRNPIEEIAEDLAQAWGPTENKRRIVWKVYFRVGKRA